MPRGVGRRYARGLDATPLLELGAVVLGLAILARLAGRVGVPAIPLYLIAGLAFGEGGLLPLVTTREFVRVGSEIGLILLLFTLGLEYSSRELLATMRRSLPAGVLDVALNFVPGFVAGLVLGWGSLAAAFLGGITLVTSSSVAAKIFGDLGWVGSPESRFVLSVSILEDLAMAAYLPALGGLLIAGEGLAGLGTAILAVGLVIGVLLLARRFDVGLGRLIFSRSDEVLVLTLVGFALVIAGLAESVQASAAIGALLAGIVLSGPAARGARALLTPLRDLFAAIFFAFIGLSVDPSDVWGAALPAVIVAAIGFGTKAATGWWGARDLDAPARIRAGIALVARGEFSLALAGLAASADVEPRLPPLAVAYVLILAILGPIAARIADVTTRPRERPATMEPD
jgi:CPA2 family monovalent cation:H+ antiporter-2